MKKQISEGRRMGGEIRNPKSEIRRKSGIRNPESASGGSFGAVATWRGSVCSNGIECGANAPQPPDLVLRVSDFGFPSDFGFRISVFSRVFVRRFSAFLLGALALVACAWPVQAASFSDGFETYAEDYLDKDYVGGANAAPNGTGNPWWGANPANFAVVGGENGVTPHSGAQMARNEFGSTYEVPFDFDSEYYDLAFRFNGGSLYYGNVVLDWWFFDPCGASTTDPLNRDDYGDFAGLCDYGTGIPANADYTTNSSGSVLAPGSPAQCLMIGAAYVWGAADTSKYQAQVLSATDGLNSAYPTYFDTATPRSVGWHNARVVVGPAAAGTHLAVIKFYIDDMVTPTLIHDNAGGTGINCIQLSSLPNYGTDLSIGGYFDDFYFQDGVAAPVITAGLTNQSVSTGDTVTLEVGGITGTPAPAFYWEMDGQAVTNSSQISGVGTSALTISGITPANLGTYSVMASNIAGTAVSSAVVGLPAPPTVDSQSPTGGTVFASLGGAVTFSVTAHAGLAINYRWSKNGSPLSDGATIFGSATATLTITNLVAGDAGMYACHLSNASGATDSVPVTLVLPLTPVILSEPTSLVVGAGSNATFTVGAAGPNLVYLWSKGATPLSQGGRISGAASATLSIAGVSDSDGGAYSCSITSGNGSATNTAAATLTVIDPPVFTLQPQPASQVTYPGSNLVFQVAAQGTAPLSYQWFRSGVPLVDGTNITGSTTASLSLTVASTGDQGLYQCGVSNFANVAMSAGAAVFVNQAEVQFTDDFETYPACCLSGGPGLSGPRGGGSLDGQGPWWGVNSPDICVFAAQNGITPHSGLQMIGGPINGSISTSDNDRTYLNLSYRFNGGGLYLGDIMLDWYFCDLYPTNNAGYSDQVSLCNYGLGLPSDAEQGTNKPSALIQRLAIGGWEGGDLADYQCAVMTAGDGLSGNNGELGGICKYFNTGAARTNGWHHARIMVGPADAASGIANCAFFIDDMLQPVLTHDNAGGIGFNSIDIASDVIYSGGNSEAAAGYFDDLSFRAVNDPFILEQPVGQAVQAGTSVTLSIAAFGAGFQWQKDGAAVGGATNMQLTLNPIQGTDAGSYACVVTGANGSVVSSNATLTVSTVAPTLAVARAGHNVVITWLGSFVLQSAASPAGPYQDVAGATSPYTMSPPLARSRFFRLRSSTGSVGSTLTAARVGRSVVITWPGSHVLQSALSPAGTYQDVAGASSPYTNSLPAAPARFFRLRN
ncbi:MAG: immunoglobulin domain-containing protein [Limisphaerales bacterium]